MADLVAIRHACQPIAAWWDDYLATGCADPDQLDDALIKARTLGPLPGRLGQALAFIIAGCLPNLNYADAAAAFGRVAAIGRLRAPETGEASQQPAVVGSPAARFNEQLTLPGIMTAAGVTSTARTGRSSARLRAALTPSGLSSHRSASTAGSSAVRNPAADAETSR